MKRIAKSEVLNNFTIFSEKIGGNLNISYKSEMSSGGAMKYMNVEVLKEINSIKISINQSFSFLFSEPEYLSVSTGLILVIEKPVSYNYYLHFWQRSFFERFLGINKLNSGHLEFDKKFSAKSNNPNLTNLIFKNKNVQELFFFNKFIILNINSGKNEIKIILKNMELRDYNVEEIEGFYLNLMSINKMIESENSAF